MMEEFTDRIVFVQKDLDRWKKIVDLEDKEALFNALKQVDSGVDNMVFQTYVHLFRAGFNVEISSSFVPNCICITHYDNLNTPPPWNSFIVAVKADRDRVFTADIEIIQSPSSAERDKDYYIPHWPQPFLIPRDSNRASNIENLVYYGQKKYIPRRFMSEEFNQRLKALGVNFIIGEHQNDWFDYSQADLVFAIREGSPYYLSSKPASKLFNAWLAGCPAFVSDEPAYHLLKKSELDFIHCQTTDDVIDAISHLIKSPDNYAQMVENGLVRSQEYSYSEIVNRWVKLINDHAIPAYQKWEKTPTLMKRLSLAASIFRKKIRGNLNDLGIDVVSGLPQDNTTFMRKVIWFLLDRYAYQQYKVKKEFFLNYQPK